MATDTPVVTESAPAATEHAAPAPTEAAPRRTVTLPVLPLAIIGGVILALVFGGGGVALGFGIGIGDHPERVGTVQPFGGPNGFGQNRRHGQPGQNGFGQNRRNAPEGKSGNGQPPPTNAPSGAPQNG